MTHKTKSAVLDDRNSNLDFQANSQSMDEVPISHEEILKVFLMVANVYEASDKPVKLAAIINGNRSKIINMKPKTSSLS